jgi:hypothetical protein
LSSLSTIAQIASPVAQIVFIVVVGLGYWYTAKINRKMIEEMRDERADMGRPMMIVHTGTERLPELQLAVENVGPGPAKGVSFEFSSPLKASDGTVLSELPLFERGLPALPPGTRIDFRWDDLDDLLPFLRENEDTADQTTVTVRYADLTGNRYEHDWDVVPAVYEGAQQHRGIDEFVRAVEDDFSVAYRGREGWGTGTDPPRVHLPRRPLLRARANRGIKEGRAWRKEGGANDVRWRPSARGRHATGRRRSRAPQLLTAPRPPHVPKGAPLFASFGRCQARGRWP